MKNLTLLVCVSQFYGLRDAEVNFILGDSEKVINYWVFFCRHSVNILQKCRVLKRHLNPAVPADAIPYFFPDVPFSVRQVVGGLSKALWKSTARSP